MRRFLLFGTALSLIVGGILSATATAGTPYEDAVISLTPNYYYQLNEPDHTGGAVDTMGNGATGSYNGDYDREFEDAPPFPEAGCAGPQFTNYGKDGDGAADEGEYFEQAVPGVGGLKNLAHCSNNVGHVVLGPGTDWAVENVALTR